MSNEEFQKLVLEELRDLKAGQKSLEAGQKSLEAGQKNLEVNVSRIEKKLDAVYEQTAVLTEFRTEINAKVDKILEENKSIHEILGEHEVSIRTLRRTV